MAAVAENQQLSFSVEGMSCVRCVRKIQQIAQTFPQIKNVDVDFSSHMVRVQTKQALNPQAVTAEIERLGFEACHIPNQEKVKGSSLPLIRLGVAAVCACNIMMLSFANYAGADQSEFSSLFEWICFFLFLPVITFCAWPLYKNTWTAFRRKKVSVDVPLTLAILGAAAISFYNLLSGNSEQYFDSLSMFVFFLLSSRYVIHKIQTRYIRPIQITDIVNESTVSLFSNGNWKSVAHSEVSVGDLILIESGSFLPFDCELACERADLDMAIFTGESLPVTQLKHSIVSAGSRLISAAAEFKVRSSHKDSRLSQLIDLLNVELLKDSSDSMLADKGAHYLSLAIVSVAAIFLGYYSFINLQEAIDRTLALLVIACPCALAIAAPLAHSLSIRKAFGRGLLFKSAQAMESLFQADSVVFDKTGTLTFGRVSVKEWLPRELTTEEKSILFSMEEKSDHPVAKAILRSIGPVAPASIDELEEKPGVGVFAAVGDDRYEVRRALDGKTSEIGFYKNNSLIARAELEDQINPESAELVDWLHSQGKKSYMMSGDHHSIAASVSQRLGIAEENVFSQLSPEEKAEQIAKLRQEHGQKVLFVGDGINDCLAMREANSSISMQSSAETTFKASDIHLLRAGCKSIIAAMQISKLCNQSIRRTIVFSAIYNFLFASLALAGLISPLVAVIIMPLSSLTVVGMTVKTISPAEDV